MRNQGLPLQGHFPQQTSVSPPLLLPPDSPHRINCSSRLLYQVFDATAHNRVYILRVVLCYIIHPYPYVRYCLLCCSFMLNKACWHVWVTFQASRAVRLVPHEWFIKSCIPIMTHCLSLFSGRKIKRCGQMAGISEQYQYFQGDFFFFFFFFLYW